MPDVVFITAALTANYAVSEGNQQNFTVTKNSGAFPSTPYRITAVVVNASHVQEPFAGRTYIIRANRVGVSDIVTSILSESTHEKAWSTGFDLDFEWESLTEIGFLGTPDGASSTAISFRTNCVITITITWEAAAEEQQRAIFQTKSTANYTISRDSSGYVFTLPLVRGSIPADGIEILAAKMRFTQAYHYNATRNALLQDNANATDICDPFTTTGHSASTNYTEELEVTCYLEPLLYAGKTSFNLRVKGDGNGTGTVMSIRTDCILRLVLDWQYTGSAQVNVSGVYKTGMPQVNVSGVHKDATAQVNVSGVYKDGLPVG